MDYTLRKATIKDYEFFYQLNKTTMKKIVEKVWGWDENFQIKFFKERFTLPGNYVIQINGKDVGRLQYEIYPQKITLKEIQIIPEYQKKGIGTNIVSTLIDKAKKSNKCIELQVIKINEIAKRIYKRFGFTIFSETETHYLMKRE